MEKFQNKYRIASARLSGWDYASSGMYFITICTKHRDHYFGEINRGEMYLNDVGKITDACWGEIPDHFKNVELGEFVVMPNHLHGIIIINDTVETGHVLSLQTESIKQSSKLFHPRFRNQGKNTVSAMVGSFKSAVTRMCRTLNPFFGWQSRFYDHIIRTHDDFVRISRYIVNNPGNWKEDRFFGSIGGG